MKALYYTIPFLVITALVTDRVEILSSDTLVCAIHILVTPSSSPLTHSSRGAYQFALYTFHSVSDRNPIRLVTKRIPTIYC
jgi:hypothetical protein